MKDLWAKRRNSDFESNWEKRERKMYKKAKAHLYTGITVPDRTAEQREALSLREEFDGENGDLDLFDADPEMEPIATELADGVDGHWDDFPEDTNMLWEYPEFTDSVGYEFSVASENDFDLGDVTDLKVTVQKLLKSLEPDEQLALKLHFGVGGHIGIGIERPRTPHEIYLALLKPETVVPLNHEGLLKGRGDDAVKHIETIINNALIKLYEKRSRIVTLLPDCERLDQGSLGALTPAPSQ